MFITFEGSEGAGKTTIAKRLLDKLQTYYDNIVYVREPGGTPAGDALRAILLHGYEGMPAIAEACIVAASRAVLLQTVVRPALQEGKVVICDRYIDTTLTIQGYGMGLDLDMLRQLCHWTTGGLMPDKTFYLDIDPLVGVQRKKSQADEYCHMDDRAKALGQVYQDGYKELITIDPWRWSVIDATQPIDTIVDVCYWQTVAHPLFTGTPKDG
jgi:dTMP kinase